MPEPDGFLRRQRGAVPDDLKGTVEAVWKTYGFLTENQWQSRRQLEANQLRDARLLVAHCREQVPYYERSLRAAGVDPRRIDDWDAFRRIPILARSEFHAHFAELEARALPAGTTAANQTSTSGSSGIPIVVRRTNIVNLAWLALFLRNLRWNEIDPREPRAVLRYRGPQPPGTVSSRWGRVIGSILETGPIHRLHSNSPLAGQLAWLRAANPGSLVSYPSLLENIAGAVEESGERFPQLRVIESISETLEPEVQTRIERNLGAKVRNVYSSEEAGSMASPCPEASQLHVHAESVILEVVDDAGRPCRPGTEGRVLVTTLRNFRAPFLRYDIGDRAVAGGETCPCGRGLPLLGHVFGKVRPLMTLADGRRKHASGMAKALGEVPGCRQFQLVQRALDEVQLRVVPSRQWSDESRRAMERLVSEFFEFPMRVQFDVREEIPRPPGGKFQIVVNALQSPAANVPQ